MIIDCPHGPTNALGHSFIVGFREGEKEILGATPLPWMPSSIVSSAPGLTPLTPVPPTPLETLYYIDPTLAEEQLVKERWWDKRPGNPNNDEEALAEEDEEKTYLIRNETYLETDGEFEAVTETMKELEEGPEENENNADGILVTCPWCKDKFSPKDYLEHFDVCEKRLAHITPVKTTIKIITNEEEEIPAFLERLEITEEEPEIPWITRIGRRPR